VNLRSLHTAPFARVVLPLAVVGIVVAVNQTTVGGRSSRVLGLKVERCTVGGEVVPVTTGARIVRADRLTLAVAQGRPGATLAPPTKLKPGATGAVAPVTVTVGLRSTGPRRLALTMIVRNLTDCPAAVSVGRITAVHGSDPASVVAVTFGGRDRVIVPSGARTVGHADLPVERDGNWRIDGSAYADIGAAS
jgi:hypothetical protein